MAGGFVAGVLLLGTTMKSVRSSQAFQASHNEAVEKVFQRGPVTF
jgi:hypothetical protein